VIKKLKSRLYSPAFGVNGGSCSKPAAPVRDLILEERNKKIMTDFFDGNCKHDLSVFDTYVAADLIQHNANLADGRTAFKEFSRQLFQSSPTDGYYYVERVAADGDLVWIHLLSPGTQHAVVTIFRLKDGLIREHWDVIQPIPETSLNLHPCLISWPINGRNGASTLDLNQRHPNSYCNLNCVRQSVSRAFVATNL